MADDSYVNCLINETSQEPLESSMSNLQHDSEAAITNSNAASSNDVAEKDVSVHKINSAVWTISATSTLLKLYEAKLEMLETPKKKTRIWIAISENLKDHSFTVTPDQVRWKINALTKKYKRCIDMGKHEKFKYFQEMDNIYSKYNVDCDSYTITEFLHKNKINNEESVHESTSKPTRETRAMIEMRKVRLANRIDSERFQSKIKLERQWLEYLHKQEEQKHWRDEVFHRKLKLREEELEIRKRELELRESLEYRKLQLMEKQQNELLQLEREKCELLQLFCQNY